MKEIYALTDNVKNECGFYRISDVIEVIPNKKEEFNFEEVSGYYVENLRQILDFKKRRNAPKDKDIIYKIENYIKHYKK